MRCGSGAVIYFVEWMSAGIAVRLSFQPLGGALEGFVRLTSI